VNVTALLFARLREQAGGERFPLELPAGSTVADAYAELRRPHPALEARREIVRAAVNQEFAGWEDALAEGDEVAFIPPVSGGSEVGVLFELTDKPLDARRLEAAVARAGPAAI
jgi:molybdopterin synthase catalytic subunit